jgi:hypothetical protein
VEECITFLKELRNEEWKSNQIDVMDEKGIWDNARSLYTLGRKGSGHQVVVKIMKESKRDTFVACVCGD